MKRKHRDAMITMGIKIAALERLSRNEQVIKVPSTITGDFALYVEPNGTMTYEPVGKP